MQRLLLSRRIFKVEINFWKNSVQRHTLIELFDIKHSACSEVHRQKEFNMLKRWKFRKLCLCYSLFAHEKREFLCIGISNCWLMSPNTFLGKKEELEALKGELNDSRQQLQLVEKVGLVKHILMVTLGVCCCSSLCEHSSTSEPCRAESRDCFIAFFLLSVEWVYCFLGRR